MFYLDPWQTGLASTNLQSLYHGSQYQSKGCHLESSQEYS